MGPEIIIDEIKLIYWNLYQFDISIWENQKERFFIRQSELLKKLWTANKESEELSDLKLFSFDLIEQINKWEILFIKENGEVYSIDEAKQIYNETMEKIRNIENNL